MAEQNKEESKAKKEKVQLAVSRFDIATKGSDKQREKHLEDTKFRAGDQWPDEIKTNREKWKRPTLTINKMPQHIHQITNNQRQNRPAIKAFPVDDKGDLKTAKVIQGIVKHIENNSNADDARDTAFGHAVTGGFGYYRILTDYVSPLSFNLEILIKRIPNPLTVRIDPFSKEMDGSDMNYGFIDSEMSKEEFKKKYPKATESNEANWAEMQGYKEGWFSADGCRVVEYFAKEYKAKEICLLKNGEVKYKDELKKDEESLVVKSRETLVYEIVWYKLNGIEILEETIWPGRWIPIIPVYGEEIYVDNERILEGIVRHAKDPQRMYNFWASTETESIALAPKAPFIAAKGQILKEDEKSWQESNSIPHAYLEYEPISTTAGQPVPPPQRNNFEPAIQAVTNARALAAEDIKATTGQYDSSFGARSNEISARAINSRTAQAQTTNYHFEDNLNKSIKHEGRMLVDLIPKVYDVAQSIRIIGEDGQQEVIKLYEEFEYKGEKTKFDLGVGQYDVQIETGPNFATRRQEAAAAMLEFSKAFPELAKGIADLIVKFSDWPGASEIADRLRKMVPPELLGEDGQADPQAALAQLEQMKAMMDELTAKLNEQNKIIESKTLELESKERIEMAKLETNVQIELMKQQAPDSVLALQQQVAELEQRLTLLHFDQPISTGEDNPNLQVFNEPGLFQPEADIINPTDGVSSGNNVVEV